jgi:hypothetical protein
MATTQQSGDTGRGSNGFLYFAVGALIVAVGVLGYMYYSGQIHHESSIERSADKIGDAARDLGDAAKDAAHSVPTPAPKPVQPTPPTTLPPS